MKENLISKIFAIGIILLFICVNVKSSFAIDNLKKNSTIVSDGYILYVGGSGEGNYTKIQDAIDNASDGDTVFVFDDSSPYYENVVVDKSINLIGEDKDTTIIDGDWSGNVVSIVVDWVNICRFSIKGGAIFGIKILAKHIIISDNNILENEYGIYSYDSSGNNIIMGNNINSNNRSGIDLSTGENIIIGNTITNNDDGILLDNSGSNIITGNNIISNNRSGINLWDYSCNNLITGNNISSNNDGIKLRSSSGNNNITGNNIISNNDYGIRIDGFNNIITGNNISSNNDDGIYLSDSSGNNITGNNINNNRFGIELFDSSGNTITGNNISNNYWEAIYLWDHSCNNLITGNNISSNNDDGIYLSVSSGNIITGNNINNNRYGISLGYGSGNNTVTGNNINNNRYRYGISLGYGSGNNITGNTMAGDGILIQGEGLEHWNTHIIDTSNTVNGKPVIYWKNQNGGTIPADAGQVILANCTNVIVENQNITNGGGGIDLGFSSSCTIIGNTASNNEHGIYLCTSSGNTITGNNISNNYWEGIYLDYASDNNIAGNTISKNRIGIYLYNSCSNNTIQRNNFLYNLLNAFIIFNTRGKNEWKQNYWNRPRILPKLIFGTMNIGNFAILWFDIDWHPAKEPYDIPTRG